MVCVRLAVTPSTIHNQVFHTLIPTTVWSRYQPRLQLGVNVVIKIKNLVQKQRGFLQRHRRPSIRSSYYVGVISENATKNLPRLTRDRTRTIHFRTRRPENAQNNDNANCTFREFITGCCSAPLYVLQQLNPYTTNKSMIIPLFFYSLFQYRRQKYKNWYLFDFIFVKCLD